MTDREKAIVMAYTGRCMLTGDKFQIFHKYVEDILGRPVWTHDIGWLENEIKEKSKADFIALCADEGDSENQNKWIPVSEKPPKEENKRYWICTDGGYQCECRWTNVNHFWTNLTTDWHWHIMDIPQYSKVIAWMPLPEPYKAESEDKNG